MNGLINTFLIMAMLAATGIGTSTFVHTNLDDTLAAKHERGYEEGLADGYRAGFEEGNRVGYQEGSKSGYEKSNEEDASGNEAGFYFLYNPTYNEVREILAEVEMDSASGIHDYAEANGIRTAYVRCPIARTAADAMVYIYELVAFETVDKGLIIIEPSSHREVKVEVGKRYSELNNFSSRDYDDTITKITIVW